MVAATGAGTVISVGQGDADAIAEGIEVYAAIGEIADFDEPGGGAPSIHDASNLDSTAKEKIMGLVDEGQFGCSVNFDPADAGQVLLEAAYAGAIKKYFSVVLPAPIAKTFKFTGWVTSPARPTGGVDTKVSGTVSVEITGAVVLS